MSNWYVRGAKPDRQLAAAGIAMLIRTGIAVARNERNAIVKGLMAATASGAAMSKHRLQARAKANQQNNQLAKLAERLLDKLTEKPR